MLNSNRTLFLSVVFVLLGGGWIAFDYFQRQSQEKEPSSQVIAQTSGQQDHNPQSPSTKIKSLPTTSEQLGFVETEKFKASFSSWTGGIKHFELKEKRFTDLEAKPIDMVSTDKPEYAMLQLQILEGDNSLRRKPWNFTQQNSSTLVMEKRQGPFRIVQTVSAGEGPYQLLFRLDITNAELEREKLSLKYSTYHYVSREEEGGGFFARPSPTISKGFCYSDDKIERLDREDLLETYQAHSKVRFAGIENNYFVAVISAHQDQSPLRCFLKTTNRGGTQEDPLGSLFEAELHYGSSTLDPGSTWTNQSLMYVGPKDIDAIQQAGDEIEEVIDLGWFSWIGKYLLQLLRAIYSVIGNWGLAIILLTLLVKIVLFPLTEKSFRSMAKMRLLKPELDKINQQFADDREQKTAAVMELYRKQKINPFGGCLPTLLQLPIWFALYQSLSTNVELYHAPFALWWTDLSSPDPYFVLPICLGGLMFLQQKITPTTAMDPTQAKMMMYFMPIMITSFMLFLPAGLCLYMVTNSGLSLVQQKFIHWRLDKDANNHPEPTIETKSIDSPESNKKQKKVSSKSKGQK